MHGRSTTFLFAMLSLAFDASAAESMFRCEVAGTVTYSDTPCGASHDRVTLGSLNNGSLNTFTPEKVRATRKSTPPTKRPRTAIAAEQTRAQERCRRLDARLDAIQTQLRRGYTIEQGNRLHDQRRQLEAQRKAEKCR